MALILARSAESCKGIGSRERKVAVLGKAAEKVRKNLEPATKQPSRRS